MRFYKPAALAYMAALILGALALLLHDVRSGPLPTTSDWILFAGLTIAAAVSHLYPVRSAREGTFYVVANVFLFAAVILLPVPLLTVHCLLSLLPFSLWNHKRPRIWYRWSFNTAQTILVARAASWIVQAPGWNSFDGPGSLLLVLVAMVTFSVLQGLTVATMLYLNNGIKFRDAEPLQPDALLLEGILALLGSVVAALWYAQPWFLALLPVPVIITYSLMRRVQMVRLADIDGKTGLYNYRYFEQALSQELARARPVRRPTALMFMDLDYLRHINNRYGHMAGDFVLKEVAGVLTQELRTGDLVARFGGEEFVALLPGTERKEAAYLAERVRAAVEKHRYEFDGHQIRATISIGVVAYPVDGEESADLIRRADELLYVAKAEGRNSVRVAGEGGTPTVAAGERRPTLAPVVSEQQVAAALQADCVQPVAECRHETTRQEREIVAESPYRLDWARDLVPWTLAAAGGLVLLWGFLQTAWPYPYTVTLFILSTVAVVAELMRVQVYEGKEQQISLSLGAGAILAGITLLDMPGALVVAIVGNVTHVMLGRQFHLDKVVFNLGNICLATATAAVIYAWMPEAPDSSLSWIHLVTPAVTALTFYVVNTVILCLALAVRSRRPFVAVWKDNLWFAPAFLLAGLTGGFLAASYSVIGLVGATVFVTPILILRYSFSLYAQKAYQSILVLEEAKNEVEAANSQKERSMDQLIVTVAAIIDARDRTVYGHSRQVARYSVALAEELGLDQLQVQLVRIAALLHDLGKIGIPESVLHKPSRLSAEEYSIVKQHAHLGFQILSEVDALQEVARMVGEHHEYYNGNGYPHGKAGEEITIGGRIIAVADTLDTILSDRPYSRAKPLNWALEEIQRCAGSQFDPRVVQALMQLAAKKDRSFFVNSAQAMEERVNNLLTVAGGRLTTEVEEA